MATHRVTETRAASGRTSRPRTSAPGDVTTSRSIARSSATLGLELAWFGCGSAVAILALLHRRAGAGSTRSTRASACAGYHPPVMWGVYIITFVFWVGIGHAGTLISAILYPVPRRLPHHDLPSRRSDDGVRRHDGGAVPDPPPRAAVEVLLADPVSELAAHLAELQESRWCGTCSRSSRTSRSRATFLYVGLIPDIAVLRDRETNPIRKRSLACSRSAGANSDREWRHFTRAYLFLAAFATPLVLSVHSVVSFDFAMALTPGWHATIFPPYFVAGAIFSGIGDGVHDHHPDPEVLQARALRHAQPPRRGGEALPVHVVRRRLRVPDRVLQSPGTSGNKFEQDYFWNRVFGQWWWAAWIMLICNMILPLSLFRRSCGATRRWLFILSLFINIGMWFERFVIIVPSLSHEFEPWQWGGYLPTLGRLWRSCSAASAGSSCGSCCSSSSCR